MFNNYYFLKSTKITENNNIHANETHKIMTVASVEIAGGEQ